VSYAVPIARSLIQTQARHSGRFVFFTLAALAVLMSSIDNTIVAVAVPQLTTALDAPLVWVGWTLTAYQLVQVVMLPLAGKLSDSLGRKRVFLVCITLFTVGSLLCGLAPSIGFLIAFRALQAVGGGGLMPSAVGVVADQFRERRAQMIGLFTGVFPIGGIIGPNIGGFILEHWTWRELFFVNVPIGLVVILGVNWLLQERESDERHLHVDALGLALYAASIVAIMYGMTTLGDDPALIHSPLFWGLVGFGVLLFAAFLYHVRRTEDPVVSYTLLARPPFLAANLYNFFFGAAAFGFFSFVPYYAVVRFGMSAFQSGAVLTPRAIMMISASTVTSLFIIRLGYRVPMLVGMGLVATSLLLLGQGQTEVHIGALSLGGFWLLAGILAISGLGMGIANPSSNNASLDLAPRQAAALTGVRGMFRLTGGALSIASVVLALSYFPDKAQGLSAIFLVLAGVLLLTVPLTFMIPDTARDRRARQSRPEGEPAAQPAAARLSLKAK
jgi:EmrB/QacA subfamily drug resistance transporter